MNLGKVRNLGKLRVACVKARLMKTEMECIYEEIGRKTGYKEEMEGTGVFV